MKNNNKKSSDGTNSLQADIEALGLDPAKFERQLSAEDVDECDYELWEEHIPVVELFLRVIRQWRIAGESFLGIDYNVLEWVCRLLGMEPTLALLDDFQVMEAAAADILNEQSKPKTDRAKRGRSRRRMG